MNEDGIRETEIAVRKVMPEESTIDLDLHACQIAVVVTEARRRASCVELARELFDRARTLA